MQAASTFNLARPPRRWYLFCLLSVFSLATYGQGRIWYVKADSSAANTGSSWQTATSFHKALRGAQAGDQVWLAQGTYRQYLPSQQPPPLDNNPATIAKHNYVARQFFLIPSGVKVYGHFAGNETALAQRHGSKTLLYGMPYVSHVIVFKNAAQGTLLDGVNFQTQSAPPDYSLRPDDGLTTVGGAPGADTRQVGLNILNYAENGTSRPTLNDCVLDQGLSREGGHHHQPGHRRHRPGQPAGAQQHHWQFGRRDD
ncbi:hypothetical protein IC229_26195 [Spirosoma sp. BT702]|uniref:DUF1565 domain-containing protein n=1 Tax=Spirosoma profusum TaxID=2771354 RepID=A0A926Y3J5_9BACT|nr:hypothetical protein [Spirosoma profusum]MBD2704162.1 hypothetical protein [Spirosoma profusum]